MRVAALEAEATAAAAAASVAKSAAAASEERLGEVSRERAAACRGQQVCSASQMQDFLHMCSAGSAAAPAVERMGDVLEVPRPRAHRTLLWQTAELSTVTIFFKARD